MLAVILKILSILGIVLLVLLSILIVLLLVVLFLPIVYCFDGEKTEERLTADVRARWMFGLIRLKYIYPEPGHVVIKVLWFTMYDSGAEITNSATNADSSGTENSETETSGTDTKETNEAGSVSTEDVTETPSSLREKLFVKVEKIKYTFRKICDKIRHILEEYEFYRDLLEHKENKALFSNACKRIGKVLRHIRPRDLKADIVFGTGSPDTTGYAYGIYGMFSPKLGEDICITPNFEEQVLMGRVHAAGHITIFTLLINVVAVLLDKRLWILVDRVKAHNASH